VPRKPPKLSTTDLDTIIDGKCGDVPALVEWAEDEKKRRKRAGILGGRPKGTVKQKITDAPKYDEFEGA